MQTRASLKRLEALEAWLQSRLSSAPLLVFSQLQPSKLVGHLQRLLQALGVLPGSLGGHVLPAPFPVQEWTQLLDPLAGLQAATGHFLLGGGDVQVRRGDVSRTEAEGQKRLT